MATLMKLYGSLPSPYVRRVRMALDAVGYEFVPVDVYDDVKRAEFSAVSPIRKLPVLVDGDQVVYDSHVIINYLYEKQGVPLPTIEERNLVSAIDGVTDSLIILFLGKRSGLEVGDDVLLFKLQLERIPVVLQWLNEQARHGKFDQWGIAGNALICMLDWAEFRDLYSFEDYDALLKVRERFLDKPIVKATYPENPA